MKSLEIKRLKVELSQVQSARMALELRVDERLDEIERLKEHIAISEAKEKELKDKILEGEKA